MAAVEGLVRESRIVFLDVEGQPGPTGLVLPFLVTGLDTRRGKLVLTGSRPDGSTVVAGVDPDDGAVGWITELPMPLDLALVAEPIATTNGLEVVWQSGFDQTTLWSTEVSGDGAAGSARALQLGDLTSDSALAAVGERVALARVHGERQQLDLLWLAYGEVTGAVPVAGGVGSATPSVGACGDTAVVAWSGGDSLQVGRVAQGERQTTAQLGVPLLPAQLRSCRVISGSHGQIAVIWHAEQPGDPEPLEEDPGRFEPGRTIEGWVATVDAETWQLTAPVRLSPPGTFHHQGGWVGDRLVLVHGDQQPVITVLEEMR